ncbi:hypothetical protein PoB_006871800 [Plakobranchus ocellatus]|uniref:Uncharacterized protein n=1 Tax=Plakobranchus ocellatus TaxID=259542 RepID=A0AAV4DD89_9GAST|nr:hypothetical protein PoB_006871800 [Plakobranchus ocellatus]
MEALVKACDYQFILRNNLMMFSILNPQQGDFRLSGSPSDHGAGGGARTRDRGIPADLSSDSLVTEPLTPRRNRVRGVGDTIDRESAVRSKVTLLSRATGGLA